MLAGTTAGLLAEIILFGLFMRPLHMGQLGLPHNMLGSESKHPKETGLLHLAYYPKSYSNPVLEPQACQTHGCEQSISLWEKCQLSMSVTSQRRFRSHKDNVDEILEQEMDIR